jgi:hypothetical protein
MLKASPFLFISSRHCKERSNRELYRVTCIAALLTGNCFVPRNDVGGMFSIISPVELIPQLPF